MEDRKKMAWRLRLAGRVVGFTMIGFGGTMLIGAAVTESSEGFAQTEPVEENVYEMTEDERKEKGIATLPPNLLQAIHLTEESDVVRKALGEHVFQAFITNKKIEWDQYRTQVTEYELKKYLPVL